MGAVKDRLKVTVEEAKQWIRITHSYDDNLLKMLLESAKEDADAYLNNSFVEVEVLEDGTEITTELPIPDTVKAWVLSRVAKRYYQRVEGLRSESSTGRGSSQWDKEDYDPIAHLRMNPGF